MSRNEKNDSSFRADRWRERLIELGIHPPPPGTDASIGVEKARAMLRARENELNCIYTFTQMMDREHYTIDEFMSRVVDILPPWWQYPEVACARIQFGSKIYRSLHYAEGPWEQISHVTFPGDVPGHLALLYTEDRPLADEGPFLGTERKLIDAVANRLVRVVKQRETSAKLAESRRQLEIEKTSLREANAALRLILDRIDEEKKEAEREILDNMDKILMPVIRELEATAAPDQRKYLALLSENLGHITSPFVRSLSTRSRSLTTTEIQICKLIRDGVGSKQIAALRGISVATVHRHREHIRQKLDLTNQKVNLASYLQRVL